MNFGCKTVHLLTTRRMSSFIEIALDVAERRCAKLEDVAGMIVGGGTTVAVSASDRLAALEQRILSLERKRARVDCRTTLPPSGSA